ncbi:MAG: hypothetical protein AAF710_01920 [Planctomycetota bacterium]
MANIKEQLANVLSDADCHDNFREYVKTVRDNMVYTESALWKTGRTMLVFIIAFELLNRAIIAEVSFGGFKITDLDLIRRFLPLGVAYFYYQTSSFIALRRFLKELHDQSFRLLYPEMYEHNLECYVHPPSAFETEHIVELNTGGVLKTLIGSLSVPLMFAIVVGPVLFQGYAMFYTFRAFGLADIIVWIVALASLAFTVQGILLIFSIDRLASA